MKRTRYTRRAAKKQASTVTSSSSPATGLQGPLHAAHLSSDADDGDRLGTHVAHSGSCANSASPEDGAIGGESVSRTLLQNISHHAGGHGTLEVRNTSPSSCKSPAVASDADYFLQVVKAAEMCKTTGQGFTWVGPPRAASTSTAAGGQSEQSRRNSRVHSDPGSATDGAARRGSVESPDRLTARNTFLFPYIPHSLVTVHLLPCRISFTGTAPVRKYFRLWRLPTPLCTHVKKTRRKVTGATQSPEEASEKRPKCGNTEEHNPEMEPIPENLKDTLNLLTCAKGGLSSPNPESQAPPSRVDIHAKGEKLSRQATLGCSLSSCCESPVDRIDEIPADSSSPQLFEALLHGRLLRGVSLPFKQRRQSLEEKQHEKLHAELEREANSSLTENVQGYIVMRRNVDSHHTEGTTPLVTAAKTVVSTLAGPEADKGKCGEQASAGVTSAHANGGQTRGFSGVAEFVPLARVKQLCYWNHDTMPTPLDDVPQALAFMQLARIVHSMTDD